jgi:DnaK suppressor protein
MRSSELDHYRTRLLDLKTQLREQVDAVYSETEQHLANEGGVSADRDFEGLEQEVTVANTERDLLEEVKAGLARIESGVYGTCESCGADIGAERLETLPYARRCVKCA